jgi:hypothetical protein
MENLQIQLLAKKLNLTDLDESQEEMILTAHEEEAAILHEIAQAKKHKVWKLAQMGASEEQILAKLASIDWMNEIDKTEVLKNTNSNKHYAIWQQEQRKKERQEETDKYFELQKRCNAKYFFNLMSWTSENTYGKKLILHADNTPLIRAICFFFSKDERFETELKFDLNKGLLIRGVSGLGKTYLFRCIEKNDIRPLDIVSMIDISENVKEEGSYDLQYKNMLYLDDVGTEEPIVNHYGTKINWFKNFIEMYYLKNKPFNRLVISTNNSFDEIEGKYGFRVRSRVKDMFNIIDVQGKDMRG